MDILNVNVSWHHSLERPSYLKRTIVEDRKQTQKIVFTQLKEMIEDDLCITIEKKEWAQVERELSSFWNKETDACQFSIECYNEDVEEDMLITFYAERSNNKVNTLYSPDPDLPKNENRWFFFYYTSPDSIETKRKELDTLSKEELIKLLLLEWV